MADDRKEPTVKRLVPLPNWVGSAVDRIPTQSLSQIAIVGLVILTGLFSFAGIFVFAPHFIRGFETTKFLAGLYAVFVMIILVALIFGYFEVLKRKNRESFTEGSGEGFRVNRENLARHYTQKNIRDFYGKALIVAFGHLLAMVFFWKFFDLYPNQVFYMSWLMLIIVWVPLLLILPKSLIIISLLAMSAIRIMGPSMLVQLLPWLIMAPFFMVMNFVMLFGPLAIINILQIKVILPGEGKLDEGKQVWGQNRVLRQLKQELMLFVSEEGERLAEKGARASRGILMKGPPGVGKTLFAKVAASTLGCPLVITQGSAYQATFMGIDILVMLYTQMRTNSLAKEWGRAIIFIDECDQLMMRRQGMTGSAPGMSGMQDPQRQFWRIFDYDEHGKISYCGMHFSNEYTKEIIESRKTLAESPQIHRQMFPFMGGGGGSMAIYPFLTWLDGMQSPPFLASFLRNKANTVLDIILVVPPSWRIQPIKPDVPKLLFLAATNRPQVIDPALLRAGRFGRHIEFTLPDLEGREEIIRGYLGLLGQLPKGLSIAHHPDLAADQNIQELARRTDGLSPADLEQILRAGLLLQWAKVKRIHALLIFQTNNKDLLPAEKIELEREKELTEYINSKAKEEGKDISEINLDEIIYATLETVNEALNEKLYGVAKVSTAPADEKKQKIVAEFQEEVAYHEAGHYIAAAVFAPFRRISFFSTVERGNALGLVAQVPTSEEEQKRMFQTMAEGLMRIAISSIAAERIFLKYKEHGGGVSSDLDNVARIGLHMVTKWGMPARRCKDDKEKEKYLEIGEVLLAIPSSHEMPLAGANPFVGFAEFPSKKKQIALLVGQAYVDSWRALKKNKNIAYELVKLARQKGELTEKELEEFRLAHEIKLLGPEDDTKDSWPEIITENRFYQKEAVR